MEEFEDCVNNLAISDLRGFGNLFTWTNNRPIQLRSESRAELLNFQESMSSPPSSLQLAEEKTLANDYATALKLEEAWLKQKDRVDWLDKGDKNSKFFLNRCRQRWNSNRIMALINDSGDVISGHQNISACLLIILGSSSTACPLPENLNTACISNADSEFLQRPFSSSDVLSTLKA